ncbi:type IV pilus assembly protein PilM [Candidatus Saccharibacteria bacterium]|nr:type IV pilus assembly protein PilM [Candidatus Saccharibacteria bacterium]MBI3337810.1 type IV pilus assembly protein PilM [Candidatus Saccharibacteria bacterium]
MSILSGVSEFFGLDMGTTAIRLVELRGSGPVKALAKYAYVPVDSKLALSDSKADQLRLVKIINDLITEARVLTKNVAVGIPSQRVFTTVVDIERLSPAELAKSLKYQADALIPTPLSESKLDWSLLGDSPKDKTKMEVLLSSVTNEFVENRLDLLESIGLNVIAFEPDNLALSRALIAPDAVMPQMVLDIGSKSTDLVIVMNGAPRLTRSIPTGSEAIIKAAVQNLNIDEKQAGEFVFKFGLSKDKLEGQIAQAILSTVDLLVLEIDKSIKFFQARYPETKVDRIIVTGGASALPEFPLYIANKFGISVEIGNAWRNISFAADRQNELLAVSSHFGVAAGLAERQE